MNCPRCGFDIPADDINIRQLVAKCRSCSQVFSFASDFSAAPVERPSEFANARPLGEDSERAPLVRPPFLQEEDFGGRLSFRFRWFSPSLIFLGFFCIAWDAFLIFWYFLAFQGSMPFAANLIMMLFPIAHVAVGVALTYYVIAGLVNRTTITADRSTLTVRHGPLPFGGNVTIPVSRLQQLFCRREGIGTDDHSPGRAFSIFAILDDGTRLDVLTRQNDRDLVVYLEQRIEDFLNIIDVPVPGELSKGAAGE